MRRSFAFAFSFRKPHSPFCLMCRTVFGFTRLLTFPAIFFCLLLEQKPNRTESGWSRLLTAQCRVEGTFHQVYINFPFALLLKMADTLLLLPRKPALFLVRALLVIVRNKCFNVDGRNVHFGVFLMSWILWNDDFSPSFPGLNSPLQILAAQASSSPPVLVSRQPSAETPAEHLAEPQVKRPKMEDEGGTESAQHQVTSAQQPVIVAVSSQTHDLRKWTWGPFSRYPVDSLLNVLTVSPFIRVLCDCSRYGKNCTGSLSFNGREFSERILLC